MPTTRRSTATPQEREQARQHAAELFELDLPRAEVTRRRPPDTTGR